MIVHPSVMSGEAGISIPDAGVGEVARALFQRSAVRPLVDLDGQVDGGDLESAQATVAVVEIVCHLGVAARGIALGDIGGAAAGNLGHGDIAAHRGVLAGDDGTARRAASGVGSSTAHLIDQAAG